MPRAANIEIALDGANSSRLWRGKHVSGTNRLSFEKTGNCPKGRFTNGFQLSQKTSNFIQTTPRFTEEVRFTAVSLFLECFSPKHLHDMEQVINTFVDTLLIKWQPGAGVYTCTGVYEKSFSTSVAVHAIELTSEPVLLTITSRTVLSLRRT